VEWYLLCKPEEEYTMSIFQYDSVTLQEDINEKVTAGMEGLVMELNDTHGVVMFTNSFGQTVQFEGETTFSIPLELLSTKQIA
jgi:hypothetical protein